jgi:PEGA domain
VPTSDPNRDLNSRVEPETEFPSEVEINDTRSAIEDTTPTPLDAATPIAFESVPIAPLRIGSDFERRRWKSRGRIARLRRKLRKWQHQAEVTFQPWLPRRVKAVRAASLWPFAVGVLSGIVVVSALRSDEPSTNIAAESRGSQTQGVASTLPSVAIITPSPENTRALHSPAGIVEKSSPTLVSRQAPQPVSQQVTPQPKSPRPASAPRFRGRLIVDSEPRGASVMINQRLVGKTPLELPRYPASSYAVSVQQDGYHRWSAGVLVPADKVTRVHALLKKTPRTSATAQ